MAARATASTTTTATTAMGHQRKASVVDGPGDGLGDGDDGGGLPVVRSDSEGRGDAGGELDDDMGWLRGGNGGLG